MSAFAQTGDPAPSAAGNAERADDQSNPEIVVTANKRAQSINDVPMSITAITGDTLVNSGINDIGDLARIVPGYTFTQTHDSIPVLTIRGVGYYDNALGATPAVSTYVDEVPLPYPVMTTGALLDLERVEVLKGPQGTLFGQNSTGGAINIIAAKPRDRFEGNLSLGYGRFDTVEASGHVTGPLSDTLTARLSGRFERGSGWQRSYTRDDRLGHVDRWSGRLLLDWEPAPSLGFDLTLETWGDRSDTQAGQLIGLAIQFPGCQNPALATGGTCFGPPTPPITQVYPNAPRDPRAADWTPGFSYRSDNRFYRASLRTTYDIDDALSLTSISSYAHMDFAQRTDADATSLRIADLPNSGDIDAFYQELRLQGKSGPLSWLIGANYSNDSVKQPTNPHFQDWSIPVGSQAIVTNNRVEAIAGFANAEYEVGGGFTIQAGARYTSHYQKMTGCPFDTGDGVAANAFNNFYGFPAFGPGDCLVLNDEDGSFAPVSIVSIPLRENNVSWRTGLTYQPNRDVLLYANISKGYKAGSFTLATFQLVSQFKPATQESLLAYEAGFKVTSGNFQINGAGFYYDYSDKQLLAPFDFGPFGTLDKLQNVPKSRILGAEIQALWTPVSGLQLSVNGTYLDSEVTSSFMATSPLDGSAIDLKGKAFPYTPHWQGMADVNYRFRVGPGSAAYLGASASYRSKSAARFGGGDLYEISGYGLIDLRAGIALVDGKYAVDLWGRNVTNRYYRVNVTTNADTVFAIAGHPATYGIRATMKF